MEQLAFPPAVERPASRLIWPGEWIFFVIPTKVGIQCFFLDSCLRKNDTGGAGTDTSAPWPSPASGEGRNCHIRLKCYQSWILFSGFGPEMGIRFSRKRREAFYFEMKMKRLPRIQSDE